MEFVFNDYCPLKKDTIDEWECIEIACELGELKTEEHVIELHKRLKLKNAEMLEICESCPNYES